MWSFLQKESFKKAREKLEASSIKKLGDDALVSWSSLLRWTIMSISLYSMVLVLPGASMLGCHRIDGAEAEPGLVITLGKPGRV